METHKKCPSQTTLLFTERGSGKGKLKAEISHNNGSRFAGQEASAVAIIVIIIIFIFWSAASGRLFSRSPGHASDPTARRQSKSMTEPQKIKEKKSKVN